MKEKGARAYSSCRCLWMLNDRKLDQIIPRDAFVHSHTNLGTIITMQLTGARKFQVCGNALASGMSCLS
jgi:hypothetical protein